MAGRLHLHGPHLRLSAMVISVATVFTPFLILFVVAILLSVFAPWM